MKDFSKGNYLPPLPQITFVRGKYGIKASVRWMIEGGVTTVGSLLGLCSFIDLLK
jgi:hypothetical protein